MRFQNPMPDSCWFHCESISSDSSSLHSSEFKLGESFRSKERKNEFLSGRRCIHQIMTTANLPHLPVFRNSDRSPGWPLNQIGSVTHGASTAAAIVAQPHHGIIGIGIDIEDLTRTIRANITKHILTPWEIEKWAFESTHVGRETRMIFSIKEAIYKCFQPINGIRLGFKDAEIISMQKGEFTANLLRNPFSHSIRLPMTIKGFVATDQEAVFASIKATINDFTSS